MALRRSVSPITRLRRIASERDITKQKRAVFALVSSFQLTDTRTHFVRKRRPAVGCERHVTTTTTTTR